MKLLTVALGVVLASHAFAQIDAGSIVGSVRDPSGAAVPGATITLTNDATSVARSTVTNGGCRSGKSLSDPREIQFALKLYF